MNNRKAVGSKEYPQVGFIGPKFDLEIWGPYVWKHKRSKINSPFLNFFSNKML